MGLYTESNSNTTYLDSKKQSKEQQKQKHQQRRRRRQPGNHRIVESCLATEETTAKGNVWSGGLGTAVYLRIKLSDAALAAEDFSESELQLHAALEHLRKNSAISSLQTNGATAATAETAEATTPTSSSFSSSPAHTSLLSNEFLGRHCLLVSVLVRLGKTEEARFAADRVVEKLSELYEQNAARQCHGQHHHDCSILFGLAGGLQALWHLRRELADDMFGSELALLLSCSILLQALEDGESYHHRQQHRRHEGSAASTMPLLWEWNLWPYLGAGIGAVGILYALLGHTDAEWEDLSDSLPDAKRVVRETIDGLAMHLCEESGNLKDSLSGFEETTRTRKPEAQTQKPAHPTDPADCRRDGSCGFVSVGWNHGGAGYCLLLLKAFDVYGDEKYARDALEVGERVLWTLWKQGNCSRSRGSSSCSEGGGVGLSGGISGIAYVFLALARVDVRRESLWRYRARTLALAALDLVEHDGESSLQGQRHCQRQDQQRGQVLPRSNSLSDGLGGLASLLIDLEGSEDAETETAGARTSTSTNKSAIATTTVTRRRRCWFPFFESCQANTNEREYEYEYDYEHDYEQEIPPEDGHPFATPTKPKSSRDSPAAAPSTAGTAATTALTASVTTHHGGSSKNSNSNSNSNNNNNHNNNNNNVVRWTTPSNRALGRGFAALDVSHLTDAFSIPEEVEVQSPVRCRATPPGTVVAEHEDLAGFDHQTETRSKSTRSKNKPKDIDMDKHERKNDHGDNHPRIDRNKCASTNTGDSSRNRVYRNECTVPAGFSVANRPTESWTAKTRAAAARRRTQNQTAQCQKNTNSRANARRPGDFLDREKDAEHEYEGNDYDHDRDYDCDYDCDYDDAFMTDSVERRQTAEISWIKHFGTREQRLEYARSSSLSEIRRRGGAAKSFRRRLGGFSSRRDD